MIRDDPETATQSHQGFHGYFMHTKAYNLKFLNAHGQFADSPLRSESLQINVFPPLLILASWVKNRNPVHQIHQLSLNKYQQSIVNLNKGILQKPETKQMAIWIRNVWGIQEIGV